MRCRTLEDKIRLSTATVYNVLSEGTASIRDCTDVVTYCCSTTNSPPKNLFSYDGVTTTDGNRTAVVRRMALRIERIDTLVNPGTTYKVVTGAMEDIDVDVTAALEEIGRTLPANKGEAMFTNNTNESKSSSNVLTGEK